MDRHRTQSGLSDWSDSARPLQVRSFSTNLDLIPTILQTGAPNVGERKVKKCCQSESPPTMEGFVSRRIEGFFQAEGYAVEIRAPTIRIALTDYPDFSDASRQGCRLGRARQGIAVCGSGSARALLRKYSGVEQPSSTMCFQLTRESRRQYEHSMLGRQSDRECCGG